MKIVHITTVPETLGYFLRGHVRFAQHCGAEVQVIASPGPRLHQFAQSESVAAHAVEMPRRISPGRDARALRRIARRLRQTRPTLIHAHTPKAGLLGMLAATQAPVPLRVYHIHGLPMMTASGWRRRLLWQCDRIACRLAHRVYAVSNSLREVIVQLGICPADKIGVLGSGSICGVDARDRFHPHRAVPGPDNSVRRRLSIPEGSRVLGFVGRIVRDKGIVELVAAWRQLRDQFPRLHLLLVGPFESRNPVPPGARATLEHDRRVHLTGWTEKTAPYYAAMDVLALPTYREGFGQVAIEAAAMELPVVATRVPGCVDAVRDGVTGTLIPPRDSLQLGRAIERYLRDERLRHEHGRNGRQYVLNCFSPPRLWLALWHEYQRLALARGVAACPPAQPLPETAQRAA